MTIYQTFNFKRKLFNQWMTRRWTNFHRDQEIINTVLQQTSMRRLILIIRPVEMKTKINALRRPLFISLMADTAPIIGVRTMSTEETDTTKLQTIPLITNQIVICQRYRCIRSHHRLWISKRTRQQIWIWLKININFRTLWRHFSQTQGKRFKRGLKSLLF